VIHRLPGLAALALLASPATAQAATPVHGHYPPGQTGLRGAAAAQPGFMTRGVESPADYYYRRVYADAVRAVDALRGHPLVDGERVAVTGGSQGGGISLAVSALTPGLAAVMPDVPFLCDFRRATEVAPGDPYGEIVRYLKAHRDRVDKVFGTLAYFDGAILARRAEESDVADRVTGRQGGPPSTVFAAYNAYAGPKDIAIYPYNDHEGGEAFQKRHQARWLRDVLGVPAIPANIDLTPTATVN